jgi:hypothetical protein
MSVRAAGHLDIPALCVLGRQFFNASGYGEFSKWDSASFEATVSALIDGRVQGGAFVLEADESVVGMTAYLLSPLFFNFSDFIAQEMFWFVAPKQRAGMSMLDAMETSAKAQGAAALIMSALSGHRDPALARIYARRGYRASELMFIKGLR